MNKQSERLQRYLHEIEQETDERWLLASLQDEDVELRGLVQLVIELKRTSHPTLTSGNAPSVHSRLVKAFHAQQQVALQSTGRQRPMWRLPWAMRLAGTAALLCLVALFVWAGVYRQNWGPIFGSVHLNSPTATVAPATMERTPLSTSLPMLPTDPSLLESEMSPSVNLTNEISPLPASMPDEEIEGRCAVFSTSHPAARRLAARYRTDEADIMAWFCAGYGFGEIELAHEIAAASGVSLEAIFELRRSGLEWDGIMQRLGVISDPDSSDERP